MRCSHQNTAEVLKYFLSACSAKPGPRLWMDSGCHSLLDEYLDESSQLFQQGQLGSVLKPLEQSLQAQLMSQVSRIIACT